MVYSRSQVSWFWRLTEPCLSNKNRNNTHDKLQKTVCCQGGKDIDRQIHFQDSDNNHPFFIGFYKLETIISYEKMTETSTRERHRSFTEYLIEGNVVCIKCQACSGEVRFRVFEGIQRKTLIIYPHKCVDLEDIK
jgi:hypothetical protein